MPDREELNYLWKAKPEALHTLNRMAKKNPAILTLVRRLRLVPPCLLLLFACGTPSGRKIATEADSENKNAPAPTIGQAVSLLAVPKGWHDPQKTDCTGWGHCYRQDDALAATPAEADSQAAADLRALSPVFWTFRVIPCPPLLAYKVGVKAVKTSSLMDSLTFRAYTSFCYIKGKYNSQQYWRRPGGVDAFLNPMSYQTKNYQQQAVQFLTQHFCVVFLIDRKLDKKEIINCYLYGLCKADNKKIKSEHKNKFNTKNNKNQNMTDTTLQTGKIYVKDIFGPSQFYNIPEYQRPYSWEEKDIRRY